MVGAERIQLSTAPSGSASPQTFTGVTRGVDGTTKSAQVSGAQVTLWPYCTVKRPAPTTSRGGPFLAAVRDGQTV